MISSREVQTSKDPKPQGKWGEKVKGLLFVTFAAFALTVLADFGFSWSPTLAFICHVLASIILFSVIPLTHFLGSESYLKWRNFMPFQGGARFVSFQALGWGFYSLSFLLCMTTLQSCLNGVVESAFGVITLWGSLALISQVLIFSSLFSFDEKSMPLEKETNKKTDEYEDTPDSQRWSFWKILNYTKSVSLLSPFDTIDDEDQDGYYDTNFINNINEERSPLTNQHRKISESLLTQLHSGGLRQRSNYQSEPNLKSCSDEEESANFVNQRSDSLSTGSLDINESASRLSQMSLNQTSSIPFNIKEHLPIFILVNVLLAVAGFFLIVLCQMYFSTHPYFSFCAGVSAVMFFFISIFNTYGVGGRQMHQKESSDKDVTDKNVVHNWSFFQPGKGGWQFVVLQFISWMVFSASVLLQITALFMTYAFGFQMFIGVLAFSGLLCIIAEVIMIVSLSVFGDEKNDFIEGVLGTNVQQNVEHMHGLVLLIIFSNIYYVPFIVLWIPFYVLVPAEDVSSSWLSAALSVCFFVISFSILVNYRTKQIKTHGYSEWHWAHFVILSVSTDLPVIVGIHYFVQSNIAQCCLHCFLIIHHVYLAYTFSSNPAETGSRVSKNLQNLGMFDIMAKYFRGRIVKEACLPDNSQYMMGFHPHGVMPITLSWLTLCTEWKNNFPNLIVSPCSASIIHSIPLLRDFMQWFGVREVTKAAILTAFKQKVSIILVPGGQAEMIHSSSTSKEMTIHTRHIGFIRLAIQSNVKLVPVLSLGENGILDNINAPEIQLWFIKHFGMPVPYYPYGRWLLPIPRAQKITVVVGKPIELIQHDNPSQEYLNEVKDKYFDALSEMFHANKEEAGIGDWTLKIS